MERCERLYKSAVARKHRHEIQDIVSHRTELEHQKLRREKLKRKKIAAKILSS